MDTSSSLDDAAAAAKLDFAGGDTRSGGPASSRAAQVEQAFEVLDSDHDGAVDAAEFAAAVREQHGADTSLDEVAGLMEYYDTDKNGTIDIDEVRLLQMAPASCCTLPPWWAAN